MTINILILCSGNYCRSPLAEGLLQKRIRQAGLDARVYSAGMTRVWEGRPANPLFMRIVHEMGAAGFKHWPHQATLSEIYGADLILVMEEGHREALPIEFPDIADRLHLLANMVDENYSIPDPIGGTLESYRALADELADLLHRGLPRIRLALEERPTA